MKIFLVDILLVLDTEHCCWASRVFVNAEGGAVDDRGHRRADPEEGVLHRLVHNAAHTARRAQREGAPQA